MPAKKAGAARATKKTGGATAGRKAATRAAGASGGEGLPRAGDPVCYWDDKEYKLGEYVCSQGVWLRFQCVRPGQWISTSGCRPRPE